MNFVVIHIVSRQICYPNLETPHFWLFFWSKLRSHGIYFTHQPVIITASSNCIKSLTSKLFKIFFRQHNRQILGQDFIWGWKRISIPYLRRTLTNPHIISLLVLYSKLVYKVLRIIHLMTLLAKVWWHKFGNFRINFVRTRNSNKIVVQSKVLWPSST